MDKEGSDIGYFILILILIQIVLHPDRGGTTPSGVSRVSHYASRGIPRGSRGGERVLWAGQRRVRGYGLGGIRFRHYPWSVNLSPASQKGSKFAGGI